MEEFARSTVQRIEGVITSNGSEQEGTGGADWQPVQPTPCPFSVGSKDLQLAEPQAQAGENRIRRSCKANPFSESFISPQERKHKRCRKSDKDKELKDKKDVEINRRKRGGLTVERLRGGGE